jgi:predicted nucleic acid-binding protein
MNWVVDTCLVLDVLENDPSFGLASARLLDRLASDGLLLCPVSYVELTPAFLGDNRRKDEFLARMGIDFHCGWDWPCTLSACKAWNRYVGLRRERKVQRRPMADVLIGAFAATRGGLLTRNEDDFLPLFPSLRAINPTHAE